MSNLRLLVLSAMLSSLLGLAACGGGGGGYGGNNPPSGPAPSKLFGADSPHKAIGSLANPNPGAGTFPVDRTIVGPIYTELSNNIGSLALDPALDYLYVGNGSSILVFYMASMAIGDIPPSRVITNSPAGGNTGSLFLDTLHNRLYVGDDGVEAVRVFDNASGINGSTPSTRLITGFGNIFGVAVDTTANDILYVSNRDAASTYQISVFTPASAVNGSATPTRTITPTLSTVNLSVGGISLDAVNDRLYVAGATNATVMVFDGASTANANGQIPPTKTLTFPATISSVVIDAVNKRLYAVSLGAIYILNNASTATDPITVTAIFVPTNGSFTAVAVNPMTDYVPPYAQFGGRPMGCASSANFAIVRIIGSENLGPTICSPTGSRAAVSPAGTLAAGSAASDTRNVGPIQSM